MFFKYHIIFRKLPLPVMQMQQEVLDLYLWFSSLSVAGVRKTGVCVNRKRGMNQIHDKRRFLN